MSYRFSAFGIVNVSSWVKDSAFPRVFNLLFECFVFDIVGERSCCIYIGAPIVAVGYVSFFYCGGCCVLFLMLIEIYGGWASSIDGDLLKFWYAFDSRLLYWFEPFLRTMSLFDFWSFICTLLSKLCLLYSFDRDGGCLTFLMFKWAFDLLWSW